MSWQRDDELQMPCFGISLLRPGLGHARVWSSVMFAGQPWASTTGRIERRVRIRQAP